MAITIESIGATLIGAKNPQWGRADKSAIDLECKFSHYERLGIGTDTDGYTGFWASLDDPEPHGRAIFEAAKAGEYGTIKDYDPSQVEGD